MKRALATVALVAVLVNGLFAVADATQNRPDPVIEGSITVVDFSVRTADYQRGEPAAAAALWVACSATVAGEVSAVPEPVRDDQWRVTIEPAIGEHGESRLVGCLEDVTLDRVMGDVVSLRTDLPPPR